MLFPARLRQSVDHGTYPLQPPPLAALAHLSVCNNRDPKIRQARILGEAKKSVSHAGGVATVICRVPLDNEFLLANHHTFMGGQ